MYESIYLLLLLLLFYIWFKMSVFPTMSIADTLHGIYHLISNWVRF